MKKIIILTLVLILAIVGIANANVYTFQPPLMNNHPGDMDDLDHYYYYTWGIDLTSEGFTLGEVITEAELTFANITNWDDNDNVLYIHLLDNVALGVTSVFDNKGGPITNPAGNTDDFYNQGILIDDWEDTNGKNTVETLTYTFSSWTPPGGENLLAAVNSFATNGVIGFGKDPDCHYWNQGITLTITTAPAPGAILLGSIGVGLVGWLRRRRTF